MAPLSALKDAWDVDFDVRDAGRAYELSVKLPGLGPEDVILEVAAGRLLVVRNCNREEITQRMSTKHRLKKGDMPSTDEDGEKISSRQEHEFRKVFQLPAEVDEEGITASMDKGMLHIQLPKQTESGRKLRIPVIKAKL